MEEGAIIVTVLALFVGYLIWDTYYVGDVEPVQSTVDNHVYHVRTMPDKQEAANLLADIRRRLETLVAHLAKSASDDPRTQRVIHKFHPEKISEGPNSEKYTSYSINKGERIVFCLRSKDAQKKLVDINTMMYVAVHELAHIATESVGHTEEFWNNMRWLLEESVNIGVYQQVDYEQSPTEYCGTTISSSVLKK